MAMLKTVKHDKKERGETKCSVCINKEKQKTNYRLRWVEKALNDKSRYRDLRFFLVALTGLKLSILCKKKVISWLSEQFASLTKFVWNKLTINQSKLLWKRGFFQRRDA